MNKPVPSNEFEAHYPADWIVIQNKIRECFKGMSLDEKRLFILATPYARTTRVKGGECIHISAAEFASACNIDITTAYTALERATDRIFNRFFSYVSSSDEKRVKVRWIYKSAYGTGGADIYFTDDVLLLLRTFDAVNPYTKYKKETVLKLKKEYSLDIYHLAKKAQNLGSFDFLIEEQMEELSLPPSYVNLSNFKSRVLEPSVNEINTQTDVTLSYESIKKGKKIIGYKILVKAKETAKAVPTLKGRDKNTIDMFCKLTDAQIAKYSSILSKLPELSDLSNFPTYDAFAIYIGNILRDKNNTKNPETAERIFKALHEKTDFK